MSTINLEGMTPAYKATDRTTGNVYYGYRIPASKKGSYIVWVREGIAVNCTCKSRKFNHGKACKHMINFNAALKNAPVSFPGKQRADVQPVPAKKPAAKIIPMKKAEPVERGTLNGGNRGWRMERGIPMRA